MVRSIVILLVLFIMGCSSEPEIEIPEEVAALENVSVFSADSEPSMELLLTHETSFGDTDELFLGGSIRSVTDHEGRVILADLQQTQLHLYNADGSYNRPIGREGEGPGEYRFLGDMVVDDQYLHLMDRQLNRITRYDLVTFEVVGETSITIEQEEENNFRYPQNFHVAGPEEYLMILGRGFSTGAEFEGRRTIDGVMMNWSEDSLSTNDLFSFDASERLVKREGGSVMVMTVDYNRSSVIDVENRQIIHGWNEDFLFKVHDQNGNYQRAIYYPYENLPLDRDEVLEEYSKYDEQWFSMVRDDEMPDVWPSWKTFSVDDEGRIWVERYVDDHEQTVLYLLSESGELLGTASWNSDKAIQDIKDGYLYSREENDMGLLEIVKYSVELE